MYVRYSFLKNVFFFFFNCFNTEKRICGMEFIGNYYLTENMQDCFTAENDHS